MADSLQHGVLNLLKPPGMTSHDAVAFVRRVLKTKRVGHTGTLDPAATGVLPICVGAATRLADFLQANTKTYLAEVSFGFQTDTLDRVGIVLQTQDTAGISRERIESVLPLFRGEIAQVPPLYSAVKIGGQKLYNVARAGQNVEIPARTVTIHQLQLSEFFAGQTPRAFLRIECSSGTYIRSLARDIALALKCCATMTFLIREKSGIFALDNALTPEEFAHNPRLESFESALASCGFSLETNDDKVAQLKMGRLVRGDAVALAVRSSDGLDYALTARDPKMHGFLKPEKVFNLRV